MERKLQLETTMARPITIKINVTKVLKQHLYQGKNGKYLDLAAFPNKDGPDQYGNMHFVCQEVSKEARQRGEKGPIIGNLRMPDGAPPPPRRQPPPPQQRKSNPVGDAPEPEHWEAQEDSSIPF